MSLTAADIRAITWRKRWKNRMRMYGFIGFCALVFIGFQVMSEELPITVTIINCVDYPDDERCIRLNEIEPSAGDYHPPEWTPEEPVMEHME